MIHQKTPTKFEDPRDTKGINGESVEIEEEEDELVEVDVVPDMLR